MPVPPLLKKIFVIRDDGSKRLKLSASYAHGQVLEIGCAQRANPYLRCEELIGFDIQQPSQPLPANYSRFVRGDLLEAPSIFGEQVFDTLVALEVIEHIPDHCAAMSVLASLLKPNGLLVLSTPNPYYWTTVLGNVFFRCGLVDTGATFGPYYGHIHLHLPRILNRIANERGLVVERIRASTGLDVPLLATNLLYVYRKTGASRAVQTG